MSCTAWNEWTKSDKIGVKKKERSEKGIIEVSKKERNNRSKQERKE